MRESAIAGLRTLRKIVLPLPGRFGYITVGTIGFLLHWGVLTLLASFGVGLGLGNLVAFILSFQFTYFLNARLTFGSRPNRRSYLLYLCVIGAIVMFTGWAGELFGLSALSITAISTGFNLTIGFWVLKTKVFSQSDS